MARQIWCALGQSLLHNTSVVSIGLTITGAVDVMDYNFDDQERSAATTTTAPILQYLRHNTALRSATVWEGCGPEDPVEGRPSPSGHVMAAIAKSLSIEHLDWYG